MWYIPIYGMYMYIKYSHTHINTYIIPAGEQSIRSEHLESFSIQFPLQIILNFLFSLVANRKR